MFTNELQGDDVAGVGFELPLQKLRAIDLDADRDLALALGVANSAVVALEARRAGEEIAAPSPGPLFLNIVRHPVAAVLSRRKAFAANRETRAAELARLWNRSVAAAEEFTRHHPLRMHTLRYEDLAADAEGEMSTVAAFLGAEFSAVVLGTFSRSGREIRHDWETWKKGVGRSDTFDGNASHFADAPLAELLVIQKECREAMVRWNYRPLHPLRQKIYGLTGWPGFGAGRPS